MNDYFLVQFAKEIRKTTAQLTLSDMLKFNKWRKEREFIATEFPQVRVNESLGEMTLSQQSKKGNKFTRTKSIL